MAKKKPKSKKRPAAKRKKKAAPKASLAAKNKKKKRQPSRKKKNKKTLATKPRISSSRKKNGGEKVVIPRSRPSILAGVTNVPQVVALAGGAITAGAKIAPSHAPAATGTMGLVVRRGEQQLFLTCAHVVAGGTDPTVIDKNPPKTLLQVPSGAVGTVLQGRRINWELDQFIDCALVEPQGVAPLPGIPGVPGPLVFSRLTEADRLSGVQLFKLGAQSNGSRGTIVSISSPPITMQDGTVVFCQIRIRALPPPSRFAERGDSGAVVCAGNRVVGMVRGIDSSGFAIACHMPDVAAILNITP